MTSVADVSARILCVVAAVVAAGFALAAVSDLAFTGFPDSHLTDYAKAVDVPKQVLLWVEIALMVLFAVLAALPISARTRVVAAVGALVALAAVAAIHWIGIPWYFGTHLGLDNGIGG